MSPASCRRVELGHEFAVGGPRGGEILFAFPELQAQVYGLLLEVGDALAGAADVGGVPSPDRAMLVRRAVRTGRRSSCVIRACMRAARSWAASRSACREARLTAGPRRRGTWRRGFQGVDLA